MINFTTDFKAAATADIRDPRALVDVSWGSSPSDTNWAVSSNSENYINRSGQVRKELEESGGKWMILGQNTLDGSYSVCPASDDRLQMGWFGTTNGDNNGDFATSQYIEVTHDSRPYNKLKVVGDSEYNEYPVNFTLTVTHDSGVLTIPVTGNTQRIYETSFTVVTGVTKIKLDITKWSVPDTVTKIVQFSGSFVERYDSSDIPELSILEESNADTGVVPIGSVTSNELDLSLLNTARRFSYGNTDSEYNEVLISGRKIEAWLGFVLPVGSTDQTGDVDGYIVETVGSDKIGYMPYGTYWSKDWISTYTSMETTTTSYDIVERLRNTDFLKSLNYTDTYGNIIDSILTEAKKEIPELTWTVSSDISSITANNVSFDSQSYLGVLKDICEATLSYAYADRTGGLVIGTRLGAVTPVDPEQELDLSKYYNFESTPKIDELINTVRVGYTTKTLGDPDQDIYTDDTVFEIPAGATELKLYIEWSAKPVLISSVLVNFLPVTAAGALTAEVNTYANGAEVTVSGTAGDTFTISATGTPYVLEEATETADLGELSINRYGVREFVLSGNKLITSSSEAISIAQSLLSFYGDLRNDAAIEWPSSTLLSVGDTAEVTEFKSDTVETKDYFVIKRQTTTFDGSIKADAELRRG